MVFQPVLWADFPDRFSLRKDWIDLNISKKLIFLFHHKFYHPIAAFFHIFFLKICYATSKRIYKIKIIKDGRGIINHSNLKVRLTQTRLKVCIKYFWQRFWLLCTIYKRNSPTSHCWGDRWKLFPTPRHPAAPKQISLQTHHLQKNTREGLIVIEWIWLLMWKV